MIGYIVAFTDFADHNLPVGQWVIVRQFNEDLKVEESKSVRVSLHGIEMTGLLIEDSVYVY